MKKVKFLLFIFNIAFHHLVTVQAISNKPTSYNVNEINDEKRNDGEVITAESQNRNVYQRPDYLDHRGAVALPPSGQSAPGGYGNYQINSGYGGGQYPGYQPGVYVSGNGYSYGTPQEHTGHGGGTHHHHPDPHVPENHHIPSPVPHYGGYGGGYGAPGHDGYGEHHHGQGGVGMNKKHLLKGLLLPIAGVAILGAAAALASAHPVLLQLGVVSGRRRRRSTSTPTDKYPPNPYVQPTRK